MPGQRGNCSADFATPHGEGRLPQPWLHICLLVGSREWIYFLHGLCVQLWLCCLNSLYLNKIIIAHFDLSDSVSCPTLLAFTVGQASTAGCHNIVLLGFDCLQDWRPPVPVLTSILTKPFVTLKWNCIFSLLPSVLLLGITDKTPTSLLPGPVTDMH